MSYQKYLQSDHWKKLKKRFYGSKRFNGYCFICECSDKLQLHHKTYKNLGEEKLQNLVALCADCHYSVHFENGQKLPMNKFILNDRVYILKTKRRLEKWGNHTALP